MLSVSCKSNYKPSYILSNSPVIQKFEEEDKNEVIKLQVTPIQGKVNKYKISYFEKQPNGNLKDVLTDELLVKIGFNVEYASQDSAQIDTDKNWYLQAQGYVVPSFIAVISIAIIFGFLVIIDSNKAQKENKKNKKNLLDSLNDKD